MGIGELLGVGPLVQELVCRVELSREAPLAKPKRRVAERSVGLHALKVADADQVRLLVRMSNALWNMSIRSESTEIINAYTEAVVQVVVVA